jgi:phospholipid/cholesterol/gamma-HCH transport system substrate-binding protein
MSELARPQRVVLGLIATVLTAGLLYGGTQVALGALNSPSRIQVVLGEVGQGLVSGSEVSMRGIDIGEVLDIELTDDKRAVVTLSINESAPRIPERSAFIVEAKTLIGPNRVAVRPNGPLEQGPYLADGARVVSEQPVDQLEEVFAELTPLVNAVEERDVATVIDDFFGAVADNGQESGRLIDESAGATDTLTSSLNDQLAVTDSTASLAGALADRGDEVNRLARALNGDLPVLTDNQATLDETLVALEDFSAATDRVIELSRADIETLLADGVSITRLVADYRQPFGQIVTGLGTYTSKFTNGFRAPGIEGLAARFAAQLDLRGLSGPLCEAFQGQLPSCEGNVAELPEPPVELPDALDDLLPDEGQRPRVPSPGGGGPLTPPEIPGEAQLSPLELSARSPVDSLAKPALQAPAPAELRTTEGQS